MRKPIIAVDMDDTICQLVKRAIYYNNIEFPTHQLRYEDILDWNTDPLRHPQSTPDVFFGRPGLFEELEVFDGYVVEEMEKLCGAFDVVIVTAAQPKAVIEKWNWIQKHMPFIPIENFFICKRKNLIDYDLLIDDGPHNLVSAMEDGKRVLCIPHPWNLRVREQHNLLVMESWQGAKERIESILGIMV